MCRPKLRAVIGDPRAQHMVRPEKLRAVRSPRPKFWHNPLRAGAEKLSARHGHTKSDSVAGWRSASVPVTVLIPRRASASRCTSAGSWPDGCVAGAADHSERAAWRAAEGSNVAAGRHDTDRPSQATRRHGHGLPALAPGRGWRLRRAFNPCLRRRCRWEVADGNHRAVQASSGAACRRVPGSRFAPCSGDAYLSGVGRVSEQPRSGDGLAAVSRIGNTVRRTVDASRLEVAGLAPIKQGRPSP
jgi:hypothetical protein